MIVWNFFIVSQISHWYSHLDCQIPDMLPMTPWKWEKEYELDIFRQSITIAFLVVQLDIVRKLLHAKNTCVLLLTQAAFLPSHWVYPFCISLVDSQLKIVLIFSVIWYFISNSIGKIDFWIVIGCDWILDKLPAIES